MSPFSWHNNLALSSEEGCRESRKLLEILRVSGILERSSAAKEEDIKKTHATFHVDKLKRLIETSLDDDKAQDIVAIDLAGKSSLADYMIVASGTSQRHIATCADHVAEKLERLGLYPVPMDGRESSEWLVVDAGSVIVHLFRPETRRHYNLEKMWAIPMPALEAAL